MIPHVIQFTLVRKKIKGLLLSGIISTAIGCLLIYVSQYLQFGSGKFFLLTIGAVSLFISLFCFMGFYRLKKEKFTAMYISDEGINDISTGNDIGTVLWKDVENIKIMSEIGNPKGGKYIVLKIKNPDEYIHREPNRSKRRTLELKLQYYGSPICFSNRALNCTFEQLKDAVFLKYNQYKDTHSS